MGGTNKEGIKNENWAEYMRTELYFFCQTFFSNSFQIHFKFEPSRKSCDGGSRTLDVGDFIPSFFLYFFICSRSFIKYSWSKECFIRIQTPRSRFKNPAALHGHFLNPLLAVWKCWWNSSSCLIFYFRWINFIKSLTMRENRKSKTHAKMEGIRVLLFETFWRNHPSYVIIFFTFCINFVVALVHRKAMGTTLASWRKM